MNTTPAKSTPVRSANAGHDGEHAASCGTCALVLREELRFLVAQKGLAD